MRNNSPKLLLLGLLVIISSCCFLYGDHSLGGSLSLLEGDRREDRVIVFCPNSSTKCCTGGSYVVPPYERHYNEDGTYREYIDEVNYDEDWVVARTMEVGEEHFNFWIINQDIKILSNYDCDQSNCDSIIKTFVRGPYDPDSFQIKLKELGVNLSL